MERCLLAERGGSRRIDLLLRWPADGSLTVDHVPPRVVLVERGLDPYDPRFGRPAHLLCNRMAGASLGGKRLAAERRRRRVIGSAERLAVPSAQEPRRFDRAGLALPLVRPEPPDDGGAAA